jgi:hypothetical protein
MADHLAKHRPSDYIVVSCTNMFNLSSLRVHVAAYNDCIVTAESSAGA